MLNLTRSTAQEATEDSAPASPRRTGLLRRGQALALASAVCLSAAAAVGITAAPAEAGIANCYKGVDAGSNNHWAWGSCTGVTGNSHWRLHVSCTWGDTRYSSWIYGDARTDVQCPGVEEIREILIDSVI